jgi:hypothetical protein
VSSLTIDKNITIDVLKIKNDWTLYYTMEPAISTGLIGATTCSEEED